MKVGAQAPAANRNLVSAFGSNFGAQLLDVYVRDPSGTATLILPQDTFGTPGKGWEFTVAHTGQGAGQPPVRDRQATPQQYSFGVCAPGGTSPICSASRSSSTA